MASLLSKCSVACEPEVFVFKNKNQQCAFELLTKEGIMCFVDSNASLNETATKHALNALKNIISIKENMRKMGFEVSFTPDSLVLKSLGLYLRS